MTSQITALTNTVSFSISQVTAKSARVDILCTAALRNEASLAICFAINSLVSQFMLLLDEQLKSSFHVPLPWSFCILLLWYLCLYDSWVKEFRISVSRNLSQKTTYLSGSSFRRILAAKGADSIYFDIVTIPSIFVILHAGLVIQFPRQREQCSRVERTASSTERGWRSSLFYRPGTLRHRVVQKYVKHVDLEEHFLNRAHAEKPMKRDVWIASCLERECYSLFPFNGRGAVSFFCCLL